MKDERGPGLDLVCVLCAAVVLEGLPLLFVFVYFIIKIFKCSPVPASLFPYLLTSLHWCRNPGGRRDTLS